MWRAGVVVAPLLRAGTRAPPIRRLARRLPAADTADAEGDHGHNSVASSVRQLFRGQGVSLSSAAPEAESTLVDERRPADEPQTSRVPVFESQPAAAGTQHDAELEFIDALTQPPVFGHADAAPTPAVAGASGGSERELTFVDKLSERGKSRSRRRQRVSAIRKEVLQSATGDVPTDLPGWAVTRDRLHIATVGDVHTLLDKFHMGLDTAAVLARLFSVCHTDGDKATAKAAVMGDGDKVCGDNVAALAEQLAARRKSQSDDNGSDELAVRLDPFLCTDALESLVSLGVPYTEGIVQELAHCLGSWAEKGDITLPRMVHLCLRHSVALISHRQSKEIELLTEAIQRIKHAIARDMCTCEDAGTLLDVFAHCELASEPTRRLELRLRERIGGLQPVQLIRLVALLAGRHDRNVPMLNAALEAYEDHYSSESAASVESLAQLYRLLSSLARLNYAPADCLALVGAQMCAALADNAHSLKWVFVNNVLFTMGKLRWSNDDVFRTLVQWMRQQMGSDDFGGAVAMNYATVLSALSRCNVDRTAEVNELLVHIVGRLRVDEYSPQQRLDLLHSAVVLDAQRTGEQCEAKLAEMANDQRWCRAVLDSRLLPPTLVLSNRMRLLNIFAALYMLQKAPQFVRDGEGARQQLGVAGSEQLKETASRLKYGRHDQTAFQLFLQVVDRLAPLGVESSVKSITHNGVFVDALLCPIGDGTFAPVHEWDSLPDGHQLTALVYWMYRHKTLPVRSPDDAESADLLTGPNDLAVRLLSEQCNVVQIFDSELYGLKPNQVMQLIRSKLT